VAAALTLPLQPDPALLGAAVLLDLAVGDPRYGAHPVRMMGRTLTGLEQLLRRAGASGYGGGIALFVMLALTWAAGLPAAVAWVADASPLTGRVLHGFLLYSLLALGDLIAHVRRVDRALLQDDLPLAHQAIAQLVGRDTAPMDAAACRRAAIESLSENLTDGFTSPLFWYTLLGLPGLLLFKVASTMDSMVGYKTPRYLQFGWCGARVDDAMNYVPSRLTWLLLALMASIYPGGSGRKALRVGFEQHQVLPGPNSGWSEAAVAGAIQRRLVGPLWMGGQLVTDVWIGDPADPPAGSHADVRRAIGVVSATGLAAAAVCGLLLAG
jgi:adenosylcobinamide-phosphate synthase